MMAKIDYPAAHSMDTEWFAMDEAGEVACLSSLEDGPIPQNAVTQGSIFDLFGCLDKDEDGIPLLPVQSDPFPDGQNDQGLQHYFAQLPPHKRSAIQQLALQPDMSDALRSELKQTSGRKNVSAVILLADAADVRRFARSSEMIRLDAARPLYYLRDDLHLVLCLWLQGRVLAWREMDEKSRFESSLAQIHGIYLFEARPTFSAEIAADSICAPVAPPPYQRVGTPTRPRIGLPPAVMAATWSSQSENEQVSGPMIHVIPGLRFAEMELIQLADFVPVYCWGLGYLQPDSGNAVIRRNIAIIHQDPSPQREAQLVVWEQAARQGDWLAQFSLAYAYARSGTEKDGETAFYWYQQAAQQADNQPATSTDMFENGSAAQCCVADLFERGVGVAQDYQQALHWYLKAAEKENYVAQYRLGLMYHDGRGVAQDRVQARIWFAKSTKNGHHPD